MDSAPEPKLSAELIVVNTFIRELTAQERTKVMTELRLQTMFHADLSDAHPEEDHWISVSGRRYPLVPHTPETLSELLVVAPHLTAGRSDVRITHRVNAPIPMRVDTVVRVHLRHSLRKTPGAKSETGISHSAIFCPPKQSLLDALGPTGVWHAPPIDYTSTAQSFLFHHPDVINKDKELTCTIIHEFMEDDVSIATAINNLATLMRQMGPPKETGGWATLEPFTPPENKETGFDGKTTYYHQMPTPPVQGAALTSLAPLLIRIKNDARFEGKKWTVQTGQAVVPELGALKAENGGHRRERGGGRRELAGGRQQQRADQWMQNLDLGRRLGQEANQDRDGE